jgi:putative membrane protein
MTGTVCRGGTARAFGGSQPIRCLPASYPTPATSRPVARVGRAAEHAAVGRRHLRDQVHHVPERRGRADDLAEVVVTMDLFAQVDVVAFELRLETGYLLEEDPSSSGPPAIHNPVRTGPRHWPPKRPRGPSSRMAARKRSELTAKTRAVLTKGGDADASGEAPLAAAGGSPCADGRVAILTPGPRLVSRFGHVDAQSIEGRVNENRCRWLFKGRPMTDELTDPGPDRFQVKATADSHFSWLRTRLSVERTLMSWVRTSVALIGFGFTIVQFFERLPALSGTAPAILPEAPRYLGLALIGAGVLALVLSGGQYRRILAYLCGATSAASSSPRSSGRRLRPVRSSLRT